MKREKLIELVSRAVAAERYAFYTGEVHGVGSTVRVYPAAWLTPPTVKGKTGRREGGITYRVALHLMSLPGAVEPEALWAVLERDALSIAAAIADEQEVCEVSGVSCTPARQSLTAHGEISVALTCDVKMWYYI